MLLAIDELQQKLQNVHYFPAYEIQMDELRDYRFYASDMIHPSEVAIEYIWQKFSTAFFNEQTLLIKKKLEQLVADMAHRPFQPDSLEYQKFRKKTAERKADILSEYPFLVTRIK